MRRSESSSIPFAATIFLSILFFIAWLVFFIVISNQLNSLSQRQRESTLSQDYMVELILNSSTTLESLSTNCLLDASLFTQANTDFCSSNTSITNYSYTSLVYVDWIPEIQSKILSSHILYDAVCIGNGIVVHLLSNNISATFPASSNSTNDPYVYGVPNTCLPGLTPYSSSDFFSNNLLESFLQLNVSQIQPFTNLIHYGHGAVNSAVSRSFYLPNSIVKCYVGELFCYGGGIPVYTFSLL